MTLYLVFLWRMFWLLGRYKEIWVEIQSCKTVVFGWETKSSHTSKMQMWNISILLTLSDLSQQPLETEFIARWSFHQIFIVWHSKCRFSYIQIMQFISYNLLSKIRLPIHFSFRRLSLSSVRIKHLFRIAYISHIDLVWKLHRINKRAYSYL